MLDTEVNLLDQANRIAFKKKMLDDVTEIIVFLEQNSKIRSEEVLATINSVKSDLNQFHTNLKEFLEPRDVSKVAEFYRLCANIIERFKNHFELITAFYDFPILDEFPLYSKELVQLSERISSCNIR